MRYTVVFSQQDTDMPDQNAYQKIKENVAKLGAALGGKAKEAVEGIASMATGNTGGLGQAKTAINSRQQQIDSAVDATTDPKMANGGRVGKQQMG
jgi:hypothetical protein